jgi:hypothetical protein
MYTPQQVGSAVTEYFEEARYVGGYVTTIALQELVRDVLYYTTVALGWLERDQQDLVVILVEHVN